MGGLQGLDLSPFMPRPPAFTLPGLVCPCQAPYRKGGGRQSKAPCAGRFKTAQTLCDVLRVDHFRGYEAFWAVPAGEKTAVKGKWVKSFGKELFDKIAEVANIEIIAEDLGVITPEVEKLMKDLKYPGMNILEFAYNGGDDSKYLPENHVENSVSYIGTHDNDTLVGWLDKVDGWEKKNMIEKTGYDGDYSIFFDELFVASET